MTDFNLDSGNYTHSSLTSTVLKLKASIAGADKNNPTQLAPWCTAPQWVGNTYCFPGMFVSNGGNLYQCHQSQLTNVAQFFTCGGNVPPVHVDNSGVFDGTAATVVTISNSSVTGIPCVVNWPSHGLQSGNVVVFTTSSALPLPLVQLTSSYATPYGVLYVDANNFNLVSLVGGTPISTTNAGSGTHTCRAGLVWFYRGKATGVTTTPFMSAPPINGADTMTGCVSIFSATSSWSASVYITAGLMTIVGSITGSGLQYNNAYGCTFTGAGVASGTQIIKLYSGTGAVGGTNPLAGDVYQLSNASGTPQTLGSSGSPITVTWGGVTGSVASGGLNLAYQVSKSIASPFYIGKGIVDTTTLPYNILPATSLTVAATLTTTPSQAGNYSIGFETNARWIAFQPAGPSYPGDQFKCRIVINNRYVSLNRICNPLILPFAGSGTYLIDLSKFTETPESINKVVIYGFGATSSIASNIFMGANDSIWPLQNHNRLKISFEGDSLTSGGNGNPYDAASLWTDKICMMMGQDNYFNNATGGTGFISNNYGQVFGLDMTVGTQPGAGALLANAKTTYYQRLNTISPLYASINAFAPNVHIVAGNHNDGAFTTTTQMIAAIQLYIQAFRLSNPNAILIVTGPRLLGGDSLSQNITNYIGMNTSELCVLTAVTGLTAMPVPYGGYIQSPTDALTYYIATTLDPTGNTTNASGPCGPWSGGSGYNSRYFYNMYNIGDSHPMPPEYDMWTHFLFNKIKLILASIS